MSNFESLTQLFQSLSFNTSSVGHTPVTNPTEWTDALTQVKDQAPAEFQFTKTIVVKPKTAKTAPVTPVMIIALDSTQHNLSTLGKHLSLKEMRLATPELLEEFFKVNKDSISPFALSNVSEEVASNVVVVVDSALLASSATLAFHASSDSNTVFIQADQLKTFLEGRNIEYKTVNFSELAQAAPAPAPSKSSKPAASKPAKAEKSEDDNVVKIGIECKKEEDFPNWYQQVLKKSEMLEYYDVSGCYILRPWSFFIWKQITKFFDDAITDLGVEPAYFPMFVSAKVLEKEKDHIEGFAPEVAWVTKAGDSDLEEPLAVRPTSETVMYPYYAKWVRSHRDLPVRLNQWCNVVRWEFKNPQPFLRTREFLWQEGHSAFLTKEEADKEVLDILDLYSKVYTDILAVPVIKGTKSEKEKFAGGLYTTTVEGFIPTTGRAIQGATSHCLGQNFSKMFNIKVLDPAVGENSDEEKYLYAWQNSWGLTTRTIGVMVMTHGDDKGLVLPPRAARYQVVVVPCGLKASATDDERKKVDDGVSRVAEILSKAGIRAHADVRPNYTPGYKFNHWELRGVPLRLEVGPLDLAKDSTLSVRRDTGVKSPIPMANLAKDVQDLLDTIHNDMYLKAKATYDNSVIQVKEWSEFVPALNNKCLIMAPWCEAEACEDDIKASSARIAQGDEPIDEKAPSMGAKSLCIPFEQPATGIEHGVTKCIKCDQLAKRFTLFGRSY